jgi:hypothetical protein
VIGCLISRKDNLRKERQKSAIEQLMKTAPIRDPKRNSSCSTYHTDQHIYEEALLLMEH